ncbi:MAG: hypothetical protein LBG04_01940 [Holosporaceae bacterium]|nr:hypothetical protein [Holosporaceae bacterium]
MQSIEPNELAPMVQKAIDIACQVHARKADRYGRPFLGHVIGVARFLEGEVALTCGLLHDLMEDDPSWTPDRLRAEGFSEEVIKVLDRLTRRSGENYTSYIRRIEDDKLSCYIKIYDLLDNLDDRRLVQRHVKKYKAALKLLLKRLRNLDMSLYLKIFATPCLVQY